MTKILIFFVSLSLFSTACQKEFSGYSISGTSPSNYQVLEFVENALTGNGAERKVEKVLNEKFPSNGEWSCDVK